MTSKNPNTLTWGSNSFPLRFYLDESMPVSMSVGPYTIPSISEAGAGTTNTLVEAMLLGKGRAMSSVRTDHTAVGEQLRYVSYDLKDNNTSSSLVIQQFDKDDGLTATTTLTNLNAAAYRVSTTIRNDSNTAQTLQAVSIGALTGLLPLLGNANQTDLYIARNEWCAEGRWFKVPINGNAGLPYMNPPLHQWPSMGAFSLMSSSTWSTGQFLPMGVLENAATGKALAWQIENNGPWRWELCSQVERDNLYTLVLLGPTDLHHSWSITLAPGESFTTPTASFSYSTDGFDGAIDELTLHRRASRHYIPASEKQHPLIYNDYMNALMGDPTTEKEIPLIDAAAKAGVQYYCIDCGWYDDGSDWWPSVGAWEPSKTRFAPDGLGALVQRIRDRGMVPGLWIEPEVIGVKSPCASQLPEDAFMHRDGKRIVEHQRLFLNFASQSARDYLDSVFDRLIEEFKVGYFKWDHNSVPGSGPDDNGNNPGSGLLDHTRAHLAWFDRLRQRYPDVIFEACSSGGQREDPGILSHYDLQSTSDQQDWRIYPTIAASAPASLLPEMAGNWAYPHAGMNPEQMVFALVNGLAGRMYLGGNLDKLDAEQLEIVKEAVAQYPYIVNHNATSLPRWPLGLPEWNDPNVVLEMHNEDESLIYIWNRGGKKAIDVPYDLTGSKEDVEIDPIFPMHDQNWQTLPVRNQNILRFVPSSAEYSARIFRIRRG